MPIRIKKGNKKIRNATPTGQYKSRLESFYAMALLPMGFLYEPTTFPLIRMNVGDPIARYYTGNKTVKERKYLPNTTYTPDFVLQTGKVIIVVECKGFPNDAYPIKKKIFLKVLAGMKKPAYFIEAKSKEALPDILNLIKKILHDTETKIP
jgi:predicted nuclease of restriction endonuclease-like RecB superfamily